MLAATDCPYLSYFSSNNAVSCIEMNHTNHKLYKSLNYMSWE
jgi:hypothetical protein